MENLSFANFDMGQLSLGQSSLQNFGNDEDTLVIDLYTTGNDCKLSPPEQTHSIVLEKPDHSEEESEDDEDDDDYDEANQVYTTSSTTNTSSTSSTTVSTSTARLAALEVSIQQIVPILGDNEIEALAEGPDGVQRI